MHQDKINCNFTAIDTSKKSETKEKQPTSVAFLFLQIYSVLPSNKICRIFNFSWPCVCNLRFIKICISYIYAYILHKYANTLVQAFSRPCVDKTSIARSKSKQNTDFTAVFIEFSFTSLLLYRFARKISLFSNKIAPKVTKSMVYKTVALFSCESKSKSLQDTTFLCLHSISLYHNDILPVYVQFCLLLHRFYIIKAHS